MKAEELQQIIGLIVNSGLAMSSLAIFLIARHLIYRKRTEAINIQFGISDDALVIELSNNLPVPIFVNELIWNVRRIAQTEKTWTCSPPDSEKLEVLPGETRQLVFQEHQLEPIRHFFSTSGKKWPSFLTQYRMGIGIYAAYNRKVCHRLLTRDWIQSLLKAG